MVKLGAFLGVGAIVAYVLYDTLDTQHPTPDLKPGCRGPADPALARQIANRWGPLFGCPVETLMVIAKIESGYRPVCANFDIRALTRGGAYGMWQQTLSTAKGHGKALVAHSNPDVRATLAFWQEKGRNLTDHPELCGLFAARQLGILHQMFNGDLAAVAGGYHQGAGKIQQVLAEGGRLPDDLPPKGFTYVTRALAARGVV